MEEKKQNYLELNESQISSIENLDQSIEMKMKEMLPDMIKKIKDQVLEETKLS